MTDEMDPAVKGMIARILAARPRPRFWLVNEVIRRSDDQVDDELVNRLIRSLIASGKLRSSVVDGVETIAQA